MTNSFSYRVDPIGTTDLGKGNSFKSYRKHIPVVWCASDAVRRLAGQFTVQFSSEFDEAGFGTSYTFQTIVSGLPRRHKKLIHIEGEPYVRQLEHTLITSCLLGRRTLTVCSYEVMEQTLSTRSEKLTDPVPYRAKRILVHETASQITDVAIPFSTININTGEVYELDDLPELFKSLDHIHLLYTLGDGKACLLLCLLNPLTNKDAIPLLNNLSKRLEDTIGIKLDVRYSTLFENQPLPLTVTKQGHYCEIIGVSALDSVDAIDAYIDNRPKRKPSKKELPSPLPIEEVDRESIEEETEDEDELEEAPLFSTIEEDEEQQKLDRHFEHIFIKPNEYVVGKQFFDGVTRILQDKAAPENTTPKKLTETRRLLAYILFSNYKDSAGNLILSSEAICQAIYGTKKRVRGNNFNLTATLSLLSPLVKIETNQPSYNHGIATTLKTVEHSPDFRVLWTEECQKLRRDLVWLSSGKSALSHSSAVLSYQLEKAEKSTTLFPCKIAEDLMRQLNESKANIYTKIYNEGISEALSIASGLGKRSRSKNLNALNKIRLQPIPIYYRSEKTNRLMQSGSFFSLKREIRNSFFWGYWMVDIKHCQLSINSFIWGCERMNNKLKEGNVWEYLCKSSGLSKEEAKQGLMLLMYGTTTKVFKNSQYFQLYETPEIKALIHSKEEYMKRIVRDGFAFDAYENKVDVNELNLSSRIASISQSYEFLLLQPLFQHYLDTREKDTSKTFQILLYTLDGFIYSCDRRYEDSISSFLEEEFKNNALSLGISTTLDALKL